MNYFIPKIIKNQNFIKDFLNFLSKNEVTTNGPLLFNFKKIHYIYLLIFLTSFSLTGQTKAFPTAYGAGAYTTGGAGGDVYHVTSLENSGPGTLREGLFERTSNTPRTIVFDVSGVININAIMNVNDYTTDYRDNITIAGQTAPEGGITIDGGRIYFNHMDNLIVRHIRFKGGIDARDANNPSGNDSATMGGNLTNQVWDHCTFAFGYDECASWYTKGDGEAMHNISIQRCLFAESSKGGIIGGRTADNPIMGEISVNNNLYFNSSWRFPNATGHDATFEIINNVVWTATDKAMQISGDRIKANCLGNYQDWGHQYLKYTGTNMSDGSYGAGELPQIYVSGNKFLAQRTEGLEYTVAEMNADNKLQWAYYNSSNGTRGDRLSADYFTDTQYPLLGAPITVQTADDGFLDVISNVGCNARLNADGSVSDNKDTLDAGWLAEVNAGTYRDKLPESSYNVPAIPSVSRGASYYVSNAHIPEIWYQANVPNGEDHNDLAPSGYTWLEEFLNGVDEGNIADPVNSEDVNISPNEATLNVPETIQLSKAFTPANTTDQSGVWNSSSPIVATVSNTGLVSSVSEGEATITFTANDGGFSDSSIITVTNNIIPVSSISVTPNDVTLDVDATVQLTVNILPNNATNLDGLWTSSNPDIVIVDAQGLVTGLAEGTATITFTSNDNSTISDTATVNVVDTFYGSYIFYNAETDVMIQEITGDESFDLNIIGDQINFRNIPQGGDNDSSVESVQVEWTGVENGIWTENGPIYAGMPNGHVDFNFEPYTVVEGTYHFTVTYFSQDSGNGNVVSSDNFSLTFTRGFTVSAGEDAIICEGENVTLIASGGSNYLWSTGETTQSIEVSPGETTTYTVTVSNDTISDTDDVMVNVNAKPTANAGDDQSVLHGQAITLSASGGSEYIWNTGETTQQISVNPTENTTYSVEVIENGCSDNDSVAVNVNVEANIVDDTTVCQGSSTTLSASGGSNYIWSNGETSQSIDVSPSQTTTYTVIVSNGTSSDAASVTVNVNLLPNANAGEDVTIEAGQNITLSASGGNTYLWSTGDASQNISVSPTETSTYTVESIINGCSNFDEVTVNVVQLVNANAGVDVEICAGEDIILTASGGDFFEWNTGDTTASIIVKPSLTTMYSVRVSNGISIESAEVMVNVDNCLDSDNEEQFLGFDYKVYPNPSNGEVNIKLSGLENISSIYITDLLGKIIKTETFDANNGLAINKSYNLSALSKGIYFVTFRQSGEEAITKKLILK